ncbi:hypothetical protein JCGZ_18254 [Jatropha curcas]|uniref:tRNA(adenine(34)) deaminase n=1 Tax=Jatropha curcas TaxID=180498 RepID=A0A067K2S7_JATCU|nr:tRNA(adenine(34)) deaminase, chloroplastic isoform X2 [Jatropha curcas]KDP29333.1 hypothetical protein JCGZ_18254 [Jatropha curcas]
MYNPCIGSSAVLTLRTKGSLSFSFDDYTNLLNDRFDRSPLQSPSSQCCSLCYNCCSCCESSFANHRLPIKPSLFYGLRQSTLIQFSPCKRLIFGGRDRYYYRIPAYGLDHGCYEVSCSFKEESGGARIERRKNGRVFQEESSGARIGRRKKERVGGDVNLRERRCFSSAADAEAVINFLSEEVTEEYLDDRNENGILSKRVEMGKRSNFGGAYKQRRKKNARVGLLESVSKSELEAVTSELRKEEYRREEERTKFGRKKERKELRREEDREGREEMKNVARGENCRDRKASSSFSSYYSLSSTGDFEHDNEAQDERVGLLEESSSGYKEELWSSEDKFEGYVLGEYERHGDAGHRKVFEQGTSTIRKGADWDLRKKSEKKLTEIDEIESKMESSQLDSRMGRTIESDFEMVSGSHKQIDNKNEKLNLAVNFEKGTRKQYSQTGEQVTEQSQFRTNYQEIANMQEIQPNNVRKTSLYNGREENLSLDVDLVGERRGECRNKVTETTGQSDKRRNTLQLTAMSEIENIDRERVSNLQRQSESRMKIREEDRNLESVGETNEKCHQKLERLTGQIESRRGTQQLSEISEIHDKNGRKTSILRSGNGMEIQQGSMGVVHHSVEAKEQRPHTDQKITQRIQSRKGSQDATNISVNVTNVAVIHASNVETVNDSRKASGKRMIDQGSELTSFVKPIQETGERNNQTDGSISQFISRNESHMATEVSSFQEKTSQEASGSQAYLNMVSQASRQKTDVEEGDYQSSQVIMLPPFPQVVARDSSHVDTISGIAKQEVLRETSESSSSAIYLNSGGRNPTSKQEQRGRDEKGEMYEEPLKLVVPEDAMGSAYRLEESSMQFVGEFVESAKHEALASEIQKDKHSDLIYEGEKGEGSGQYGSGDLRLKERDSRRSSGGSGVKGPSDEMWDVAATSIQEPNEIEAPEGSIATKTTVVRTGKSMWSIIADIVRLRWGSRAETPKSVRRSGGKNSSNASVSSEAWFSGHEHEEKRDKNVERERRSMPQDVTSSHHLQLMQTSTQSQGEMSGAIGSKDIIRQHEEDKSFASTILKSGSTSKGISSPSEEENLIWEHNGKSLSGTRSQSGRSSQFFSPNVELKESSSAPLPYSGMSSPTVEESYGRGRTDVPVSSSMELMEQTASAKSTDVSDPDGKNSKLKQRRLQRTQQVVRDTFDEWEEAYIRENEQRKVDEMFMREALLEAKKAADTWEVPVGAVLVQHGKIIARGYNLVEELRDSTAHAEMICIREASNNLQTWRLADTTLYVTLEPCPMCAGAILQARIDSLIWGAPNKLLGADGSWIRLFPNEGGGNGPEPTDKPAAPVHPFHPKMTIRRGILASECADVMQQFFQLRRRKKVKNEDLPPKPSLPIASQQSKILRKMHDIFHAFLCL